MASNINALQVGLFRLIGGHYCSLVMITIAWNGPTLLPVRKTKDHYFFLKSLEVDATFL